MKVNIDQPVKRDDLDSCCLSVSYCNNSHLYSYVLDLNVSKLIGLHAHIN